MSDEVWFTLEQEMMDFVDPIAERQTLARIRSGARQGNGGPEGEASIPLRVQQAKNGLRAEAIARLLFGKTIPWSIMSDVWGSPDFSDFIDVKSRMLAHKPMNLKPKRGSPHEMRNPDRAYLLCCGAQHPRWRIVGWCWGYEAHTDDRVVQYPDGHCWTVLEGDPILKPPRELLTLALAREQPTQTVTARYDDGHLVTVCATCGGDAAFGFGVSLLRGKLGTWYCGECKPSLMSNSL